MPGSVVARESGALRLALLLFSGSYLTTTRHIDKYHNKLNQQRLFSYS
jgi:hypothetical protein